jgi:hypothetical protein
MKIAIPAIGTYNSLRSKGEVAAGEGVGEADTTWNTISE